MGVWGMQDQYKQTLRFASYHAGGVALATVLLLGVMGGGFLAGLLAMPLSVTGMGVLAIAHERERRRGMVALPAITTEVTRREVAEAALPIIAIVTEAKGVCPLGYQFYVGQNWSVDGDPRSLTGVCPAAREKLKEASDNLRRTGQSTLGVTICQTKEHRVVFQLRRQPVESVGLERSQEQASSATHNRPRVKAP